jgi:hypothetical protein
MKKILVTLLLTTTLYSLVGCKSDREKEIERLSKESIDLVVDGSVQMLTDGLINKEQFDEITKEYGIIFKDSAELGYQYAVHIKKLSTDRSYRAKFEKLPQQDAEQTDSNANDYKNSKSGQESEESILADLKEFAEREYPNDRQMQTYTYNEQLKAYKYITSVKDMEVLKFAEREYPYDYSMQKHTYDNQISAKRYMQGVGDDEIKSFSVREYPYDYSMQKYTYDQQLSAKEYMQGLNSNSAKTKAIREYPNDYTMQKYTYDNIVN